MRPVVVCLVNAVIFYCIAQQHTGKWTKATNAQRNTPPHKGNTKNCPASLANCKRNRSGVPQHRKMCVVVVRAWCTCAVRAYAPCMSVCVSEQIKSKQLRAMRMNNKCKRLACVRQQASSGSTESHTPTHHQSARSIRPANEGRVVVVERTYLRRVTSLFVRGQGIHK